MIPFFGNEAKKPITDIFTNDTDIDRRKLGRTVPMRVLCLGLGRTGTASLREALIQLGYVDTYHMMSASVENPPDCILWREALAAKFDGVGEFGRDKWDMLLGHCQAVTDWPAASFAKELVETYPEAKVVLTSRNADSWFESTRATVNWRAHDPFLRLLSYVDWASGLYQPMLRKYWDSVFGGNFEQNGKDVFLRHNESVRKLVPEHNLLEFQPGDGWGPLCEFLGCPVPKTPFPNVNEGSSFVKRTSRRNWNKLYNVLFRWAIWVLAIWSLLRFTQGLWV